MNITVIGLGLIGGSFAKSVKDLSAQYHLIGSDLSDYHESRALDLGLVDECLPVEEAISKADVILLAVPVDKIAEQLVAILDTIKSSQLVIDFGSTKFQIAQKVKGHSNRANYLAAHPMAGTENTGPDAAISGLFEDKILIVCDRDLTDPRLYNVAIEIFRQLSFDITFMDSEMHDNHIAYVSHLSHVSSFMLGLTVLDKQQDEKSILNMAGSGFKSTVRLAMSSADMWTPIFLQNKENVKASLSEYIDYLQKFEKALISEDEKALHRMMSDASKIRKILNKPR
ncbi:MAG: prephenate dehydrogenase [Cyclobacteriaceae bacterium]